MTVFTDLEPPVKASIAYTASLYFSGYPYAFPIEKTELFVVSDAFPIEKSFTPKFGPMNFVDS